MVLALLNQSGILPPCWSSGAPIQHSSSSTTTACGKWKEWAWPMIAAFQKKKKNLSNCPLHPPTTHTHWSVQQQQQHRKLCKTWQSRPFPDKFTTFRSSIFVGHHCKWWRIAHQWAFHWKLVVCHSSTQSRENTPVAHVPGEKRGDKEFCSTALLHQNFQRTWN